MQPLPITTSPKHNLPSLSWWQRTLLPPFSVTLSPIVSSWKSVMSVVWKTLPSPICAPCLQ
jgi:transposase